MTALTSDELITDIQPAPSTPRRRRDPRDFARRRGDFAMAGAAVFYDPDQSGRARNPHAGAIGVADRPLRLGGVEDALNGQAVDEATIARAEAAASAMV